MPENVQLIYDGIMDALNRMVWANPKGMSMKEIGIKLYPSKVPDTARNTLSRAISEEYGDVNLDPEELIKTMEITEAPEHIIYFMCDHFGFERPPRKNKNTFEKQIEQQFQSVLSQVGQIGRLIEGLRQLKQ